MECRLDRRNFLKMAGVTASSVALSGCLETLTSRAAATPPNIIFIMSDDHASHALGCYGSKINTTPNMDRIADEGMRFDNCFCTNSICAPSRAVILTGKYSHINGITNNYQTFDGSQPTLPKWLKQAGYQTAIVGKWHLVGDPTGFDYWNILPSQGRYNDPIMIENGNSQKHKGYVTDIITDISLDWLKKNQTSTTPFFLMLHHKAPHCNWEPDKKHQTMYSDEQIPMPATFNDDYATRTDPIKDSELHVGDVLWNYHFKRFGPLPEGMSEQQSREWVYQKYMKNYLRCIASVDDNVGRVLDYLDEAGLRDNTLVVYTSDQGFFLGDHGLYDKRFMYEQSLRMPLLMRYPNEIKPGSVSDAMVLNLDFAPTFLDMAGITIPQDMQGESFRAIAAGHTPRQWRDAMLYKFYEDAYGIGPMEGIRTERFKLIHYLYGKNDWELYDLKKDPEEMQNIYNEPQNKKLVESLKVKLTALKEKYNVP